MVSLTTTQLRNILQLPERPFEDPYSFDGTNFYDLSQREAVTMLSVSGTASGVPYNFQLGIDYALTAGCIDWTVGGLDTGKNPDVNTLFVVDYTYSRLGGYAASTCVLNAQMIVAQDLGSAYPYGGSTTAGIGFNALATYGASLVAARDACKTLQASDIDLSQKARRGAVLIDDSKKTADWEAMAKDWDTHYKRYLTMIRPGGMVRSFQVINRNIYDLLFGPPEAFAFDGPSINANNVIAGYTDSGVF